VGTHVGFNSIAAAAQRSERTSGPLDVASEAKKIAFDQIGSGEKILLISAFPQTRRSWNRLIPLLSPKFQLIPADLPSFGDSGFLSAPATTENVARIFHQFVGNLGVPLAHPALSKNSIRASPSTPAAITSA
jgi:pimeloyl-ACP methyl ester carboxylesterase